MYRSLSTAHIPLHKCGPVKISSPILLGTPCIDDVMSYNLLTTLLNQLVILQLEFKVQIKTAGYILSKQLKNIYSEDLSNYLVWFTNGKSLVDHQIFQFLNGI